jgi:hypothetical protein
MMDGFSGASSAHERFGASSLISGVVMGLLGTFAMLITLVAGVLWWSSMVGTLSLPAVSMPPQILQSASAADGPMEVEAGGRGSAGYSRGSD